MKNMSKEKKMRNIEIVNLINSGMSYRSISKVLKISFSRIEEINRVYNKMHHEHCVRCETIDNLVLDGKIKNICKNCVKIINSL